jgi:hypothetical protein
LSHISAEGTETYRESRGTLRLSDTLHTYKFFAAFILDPVTINFHILFGTSDTTMKFLRYAAIPLFASVASGSSVNPQLARLSVHQTSTDIIRVVF